MEIKINRIANNGKGVGTAPDGRTVFVTGAISGDVVGVTDVQERGRFMEARIGEILTSSPMRIPSDCPETEACGGCCFRCMHYEGELAAKEGFVRDAFQRIGGFLSVPLEPIIPSPHTEAYRNKAEFAVGCGKNGVLFAGFYSEKSHRVIPVPNCKIVPSIFLEISERFLKILGKKGVSAWNPTAKKGLLRHLILRQSGMTGEIMLIVVCTAEEFPEDNTAAEQIRQEFPRITSVILNCNREKNAPVLGLKNRVLSGNAFLRDQICGVPVEICPLSFFQVNTPAAEELYRTAAAYAEIRPEDTVLDLYCGMGTIGLSMASNCRNLIGGEIIPEAVKSAKRNAAQMGLENTRFLCGDAAETAGILIKEGTHPNLIILDPPRKGCSSATLQAVESLNPERIVMVSCDPATAARDCRILSDHGYTLTRLRPVDLFPRTRHVETCILLSKPDIDII